MSLSLYTVIAEGREKKSGSAPPGPLPGHAFCNARADWALRLHSCRALSSQPHVYPKSEAFMNEIKTNKSVTHVPGRNCYLCIGTYISQHLRFAAQERFGEIIHAASVRGRFGLWRFSKAFK